MAPPPHVPPQTHVESGQATPQVPPQYQNVGPTPAEVEREARPPQTSTMTLGLDLGHLVCPHKPRAEELRLGSGQTPTRNPQRGQTHQRGTATGHVPPYKGGVAQTSSRTSPPPPHGAAAAPSPPPRRPTPSATPTTRANPGTPCKSRAGLWVGRVRAGGATERWDESQPSDFNSQREIGTCIHRYCRVEMH